MVSLNMRGKDIVEVDMAGEVTAEDYKQLKPKLEAIFSGREKKKFLFDLREVQGFTAGAMWEDVKMDIKHIKDIGTTAIVSNKLTYELLVKSFDKFYPAKLKHFETNDAALSWLGTH